MELNYGGGLHTPPSQSIDLAAYETYIGRWSRLFIPSLLRAAGVDSGDRILDLATGPGEVAQLALPLVAPSGMVVGLDISHAMVTASRSRLANDSFLAMVADGHYLPFRSGSFDAVVCQLGLQFFHDPTRGLQEAHRVLRSSGRVAVCVLGRPAEVPVWGVLADALSRYLPVEREKLHLSFALADPEQLSRLIAAAGFRDVAVTRIRQSGILGSFDEYWASIEAGIGTLPRAYLALGETERRLVREEVQQRLSVFQVAGKLEIPLEALIGAAQVRL